jgi:septum formation protein
VLASSSPRRRKLLEQVGIDFIVAKHRAEESSGHSEPEKRVMTNAEKKAMSLLNDFPNSVIISADTTVYLNGLFFGKPTSSTNAYYMLETLSGKKHQVFTGIAVLNSTTGKIFSGFAETQVHFKEISMNTIRDYVASGESSDKAGAYAIQGKGGKFVDRIIGSQSNVIGLPLDLLFSFLEKINGQI